MDLNTQGIVRPYVSQRVPTGSSCRWLRGRGAGCACSCRGEVERGGRRLLGRGCQRDRGRFEESRAAHVETRRRAQQVERHLARIAGQLGRLKLNGRLVSRSPLSDVIELEMLVVGITGKQALWESLRLVPSLPQQQLETLIERAEKQRAVVEEARREAVRRAFVAGQATAAQ